MYKITLLIIFLFVGCVKELSEYDLLHKSNPVGKYGDKINLSESKKIEDLINNSENYLDKNVLISGEILEVCPMRGCWINVKNKDSNTNIMNSEATINILKEIYLAESEFNLTKDTNRILSLEEIDSLIYIKYNTDKNTFERTLEHYTNNIKELEYIYREVLKELEKEKSNLDL